MRIKGGKALPEIRVTKNGPYLVSGELPLAKATIATNAEGESIRWEWGKPFPAKTNVALCSCGGSASKPYCDGTHSRIGFDGTETASRKPYREQAKLIEGPVLSLTDAEGLCAFARFCDPTARSGASWKRPTGLRRGRISCARPAIALQAGSSPGTTRPASRSSPSFRNRLVWSRIP
jgi:CDGSH-type Zn-finger protein